jgi:hypothetical protein
MNGYFSARPKDRPSPGVLIVRAFGWTRIASTSPTGWPQGIRRSSLDLWGDRRQFINSEEVMA